MRSVEALVETLAGAPVHIERRLQRATKTGGWLTAQPSTVNGTAFWVQILFLTSFW